MLSWNHLSVGLCSALKECSLGPMTCLQKPEGRQSLHLSHLPVPCGLVSIPPNPILGLPLDMSLLLGLGSPQWSPLSFTLPQVLRECLLLFFMAWWSWPRDRRLGPSLCCVTIGQSFPSLGLIF